MRSIRLLLVPAMLAASVIGFASWTAAATTNFDVTAENMAAYVINGARNPDLALTRGQTYTFSINTDPSMPHPFWITAARGAAETSSNAFNQGVTGNGSSPGVVTFAVPTAAPATLFYQCSFHDVMGGKLNIVAATAAQPAPSLGALALSLLAGVLMLVAVTILRKRSRA